MSTGFFMTVNANGQSKLWDMATNAPAKPKSRQCAVCTPRRERDPTPAPLDRTRPALEVRNILAGRGEDSVLSDR